MSENSNNRIKERRKYRRFEVGGNMFAVLKPRMKKLGLIKDISMGGLALKYISSSDFAENLTELDLFIHPKEFYIAKIPCTIIHDTIYEDIEIQEFNGFRMRLCRLKFGNLLPAQKHKLNYLLEHSNRSFLSTQ